MADTEPQALPISRDDDVTAKPIGHSLLEASNAGLDATAVTTQLDTKGTALLKIAGMIGCKTVTDVIEADSDGLPRQEEGSGEAGELSPEQVTFLQKLKARYERNQHRLVCHKSVAWEKVAAKLSANPAKLDALKKMDDSGGDPDVTGVEGEDFLFDDLAAKLPDSRRNVTYAEAVARVEAMGGGAKLTRPERYEALRNRMGIVMERATDWVWLDSENPNTELYGPLDADSALYGYECVGFHTVGEMNAEARDPRGAFRCSLRV